jgi:hypothetical protein
MGAVVVDTSERCQKWSSGCVTTQSHLRDQYRLGKKRSASKKADYNTNELKYSCKNNIIVILTFNLFLIC